MRIAAAHGLPVVPRGSGTGLAGAATPIGDALVIVTVEDGPDPGGPPRGPPRVGRARALQPRPVDRARAARLDLRARPVVAAGLVDRREREHERRWAALPRVRRHERARARGRHRAARRVARAARLRGAGGRRLRPARRGRRQRGHARRRRAGLRAAHPDPAGGAHDAAGLRGGRGLRRHGLGHHRAGRDPGGARDDGPGHRRAVETFVHAGYPTDAAAVLLVEVDGLAAGVEAQSREVEAAATANRVGTIRVAADAERARAPVEGTQVRVRRDRPDRAPLPPARLRGPAREARRDPRRRLRGSRSATT